MHLVSILHYSFILCSKWAFRRKSVCHTELLMYFCFTFFQLVQHIWFIQHSKTRVGDGMATKLMTVCSKSFYFLPRNQFTRKKYRSFFSNYIFIPCFLKSFVNYAIRFQQLTRLKKRSTGIVFFNRVVNIQEPEC